MEETTKKTDADYQRTYYLKHKEKRNAHSRAWAIKHSDYTKARAKRYREQTQQDPELLAKSQAVRKAWNQKNPERILLKAARFRAKRDGREFTIELCDIHIPEKCPILNTPFTFEGRYAPSLDRLNNEEGYTPKNIRVISWLANAMKQNASDEELRAFAANIGSYIA